MSLALFRERIEAGDVDETVRAHLRGCDECRALYDQLALAARALGDDGSRRERERLMKTLPRQPAVRWEILAVAALIIAVIGALTLRPRPNDVTMRGGADATNAPFSLRVYGKAAPGQKVRLIADFPASKEATVSMRAELQYFVKLPPGEALVVETRSPLRTLTARATGADDLVPVGEAFPAGSFGPGSVEVCARYDKAGAEKHCSTLLVTP